jgi:hypothetical protein
MEPQRPNMAFHNIPNLFAIERLAGSGCEKGRIRPGMDRNPRANVGKVFLKGIDRGPSEQNHSLFGPFACAAA